MKKIKGTRKLVKDMDRREHKAAKRIWKEHCTTYRAKKKSRRILQIILFVKIPPTLCQSLQFLQYLRNVLTVARRQAKLKCERIIREKDRKIYHYKKKMEQYKRANSKNNPDTPNTKLQAMCDTPEDRKEVVKKALFGEVLNEQLKENYANLKTLKEKQIFGKVLSGRLVDKYKLWASKNSTISYKRAQRAHQSTLLPTTQSRQDSTAFKYIKVVRKYYEDDENSRIGAGKRECVTRKGVKKQKRYLLGTIGNLYKKFKAETSVKISYQTFCRLRPFWVFIPKVNARDTCVCIKHSNIDLKLSALHSRKILPYNSHIKLLENTCCNRYDEQCLSRICQRCINKNPHYREFDDSKPIQFKKWVAEKQVYKDPKSKQTRTVTKYIKKYLIFVHYKAVKALKQNISDKEAIIHMDFSENYCTKYGQEIQAYHFGGSRLQLSLHTVIIYTKGSTKPYCTVSQNTTHSPAAIWVHLQPIFRSLPPNITCVHFVSDGPVTQYRNKTMFYILASRLHLEVPNVEKFSWNFSESGHGKGAPDGVGAACKRTADAVVAAGEKIEEGT
nr:unnamed protein product [Callosobruchus analis]